MSFPVFSFGPPQNTDSKDDGDPGESQVWHEPVSASSEVTYLVFVVSSGEKERNSVSGWSGLGSWFGFGW